MPAISVKQLNERIAQRINGDDGLRGVLVRAEISEIKPFRMRNNQTMYFVTLKDRESRVGATIYPNIIERIGYVPEAGMAVVVTGDVEVYAPRGEYKLIINDVALQGEGAASLALKRLRERLQRAGVFNNQRPVPLLPKKIGVVTSKDGKAVGDIIKNIGYPLAEVFVSHKRVQGEGAAEFICSAIERAENAGSDVIIVSRGGGATDELNAFNDERVALAIFRCRVPVISAVGHEMDWTLADYAADHRESTPTGAAKKAAANMDTINMWIDSSLQRAESALSRAFSVKSDRLSRLVTQLAAHSPEERMKRKEQQLANLSRQLSSAMNRSLERAENRLSGSVSKLDALSPLKVMTRGYSLTYKGSEPVRSSEDISEGDIVRLRFSSGQAEAEIKNIIG